MKNPPVVAKPLYETWSLGGRELRIHSGEQCAGRTCTMHNPSDHSMLTWPLQWRAARGIMERVCPVHGTGHPDPDDAEFRRVFRNDSDTTHTCCGCCKE